MMRWRIMRGIRTDYGGRDQWFTGTRRFQATGTGTATTYDTVNQSSYFLSIFSSLLVQRPLNREYQEGRVNTDESG